MVYSAKQDIVQNTSYSELDGILVGLGFEKFYECAIPEERMEDDTFCLWVKYSEGLIVAADSWGKNINGAHVHFQLELPCPMDQLEEEVEDNYCKLANQICTGGGPIRGGVNHTKRTFIYNLHPRLENRPLDWGVLPLISFIYDSNLKFNCPWDTPQTTTFRVFHQRLWGQGINSSEIEAKEMGIRKTLPKKVQDLIGF